MSDDDDAISVISELSDASEEFSDENDAEKEKGMGIFSIICTVITIIAFMIIAVLILYRDSRPEELKRIFEPLDLYLKTPQEFFDAFMKIFFDFGSSMTKSFEEPSDDGEEEAQQKRSDQQFQIDLIQIKVDAEKKKKLKKPVKDKTVIVKEDLEFWKGAIEEIEKEIKDLKVEREGLIAEQVKLKEQVKGNVIMIKQLNEEVTEQVLTMKKTNFTVYNVDEGFLMDIYRKLFAAAVLNEFAIDLERRSGKIRSVLAFARQRGDELMSMALEKYFYKWIWDQREDQEFTKQLGNLKIEKQFEDDFYKRNGKDIQKLFEGFKPAKFEYLAMDLGKVVQVEESKTLEPIVVGSQAFEAELFMLLSRDLNFYGKLYDLMKVVKSFDGFVREFKPIIKAEPVDFDAFERKIKQLSGAKTGKKDMKDEKKDVTVAVVIECWHRRNLLNLFTDRRLIVHDQFRYNELERVHQYSQSFSKWLKEKLFMLPKDLVVDKLKPDELKKKIESIPELRRIMTGRLTMFDHSPYEFLLDRVIKDYHKYMKNECIVEPTVEKEKQLMYFDGQLFKTAANYLFISRMEEDKLKSVRDSWPKISSDDKTLLVDETKYKKWLIQTLNGPNQLVNVPNALKKDTAPSEEDESDGADERNYNPSAY